MGWPTLLRSGTVLTLSDLVAICRNGHVDPDLHVDTWCWDCLDFSEQVGPRGYEMQVMRIPVGLFHILEYEMLRSAYRLGGPEAVKKLLPSLEKEECDDWHLYERPEE